jgi:hypothetical protein
VAIARYYKVGVFDSATPTAIGGTVATTTPTPILWGTTSSTNDCNISAIRVSCIGAAAFPSNASFAASINLTTGTKAGGLAATPVQMGQGALAANTVFSTAGGSTTASAPITGLTGGKFYWSQDIPFTAGANWGEWFTPGFEINIPPSTGFAVYITEQSAGTATSFAAEIEFTE